MKIFKKIKKNLNINCYDYYRFKYLLDSEITSSKPPILKYTLFIVKSRDELEKLVHDGYNFCDSPKIDAIDKNVNKNKTLFLYFVDRNLAHFNCIEEKSSSIDLTLKNIKARDSVFVGPAFTTKQFRGKGFHVFDLIEGFKFCQSKGYKNVYASTKTTNTVAIFGLMSAGFEMIDKVILFTFINFNFCITIKKYT